MGRVVYQALSSYQILECMEHRQIFHKEDYAVLILGSYIVEKFPDCGRQIEKRGLFDCVRLYEYGGFRPVREEAVNKAGERLKKILPFDIREADRIYIAGIHTYLSAWLIQSEIPFAMFEDGSGALSRPWVLADIARKTGPQKYEILNSYGLYTHTSDLITEKWCNADAQLKEFHDDKIRHFNVEEQFSMLDADIQREVLGFFGIEEKINVPEDCTLLLTQQFANLGQLTFEDHIRIYQYLIDFYMDGDCSRIVLKLHPDDIMYYSKLFVGIGILNGNFPAELLGRAFEKMPKRLASVSSTGTHMIRKMFSEHLEFNELYETTFRYDPVCYTVACLLSVLGVRAADCAGVNLIQFRHMLDAGNGSHIRLQAADAKQKTADVLVADDFSDWPFSMADRYRTVIFCNCLGQYRMYRYPQREQFLRLLPVSVRLGEKQFTIWVRTKGKEEKIRMFREEKELKQTGDILRAECPDGRDLELMRLKGLLEATERRLQDYIRREKQYSMEEEKKTERDI